MEVVAAAGVGREGTGSRTSGGRLHEDGVLRDATSWARAHGLRGQAPCVGGASVAAVVGPSVAAWVPAPFGLSGPGPWPGGRPGAWEAEGVGHAECGGRWRAPSGCAAAGYRDAKTSCRSGIGTAVRPCVFECVEPDAPTG